jgi:hypothetical protein
MPILRFPRWTAAFAFLVGAGLVVVTGCGAGRLVLPFVMDAGSLEAPTDAKTLTSHERAVRGIAAIMVKHLGLPVPERVTVYVYGSRDTFEHGLVHDANVSPARAAELGNFAIGIGKRRQLLLNDEVWHDNPREWLRLIAHELAHVAQIELARGEGRAEQWFAEGMAEWVAFNVLERLRLDTVAARRISSLRGIRNLAALQAARLDLESLGSPRGFTVRHLKEGSLPTYQLAFLMADYLMVRHGLPAAIEYYRLFATSDDRHENFRKIFGMSLEYFEREIHAYLKAAIR